MGLQQPLPLAHVPAGTDQYKSHRTAEIVGTTRGGETGARAEPGQKGDEHVAVGRQGVLHPLPHAGDEPKLGGPHAASILFGFAIEITGEEETREKCCA